MGLQLYKKKRNFKKTREPKGGKSLSKDPIFVIQEHWASIHHYDFRLEAFGVLKSWSVPKGPPTVPGEKRLAVEVEDHPLDYANFKGEIPKGEYGAGTVEIWDKGVWSPPNHLREALKKGSLTFDLKGKKLKGKWLLQRTNKPSGKKNQWLLIKRHDRPIVSPFTLKKLKRADPFPTEIQPQLALLVDNVPSGSRYLHEVKFDGYRTLTFLNQKNVQFKTRNGHDWTEKYEALIADVKGLKAKSAILDGEIVALDEKGHSNFSALQNALEADDSSALHYFVFDLLYLDGQDLRSLPLEERKTHLKNLLKTTKSKKIHFSEHVAQGEELFQSAQNEGREGIISKDRHLPYSSGRSGAWQKIKTSNRQELIIGGYTDPKGSRKDLGALLMGVYENKKFRYIGRVGTGFNNSNSSELLKKLEKISTDDSPFDVSSPKNSKSIHWVKPNLVAEIDFKAWTHDGILRHASFIGLRNDKKAKTVVAEKPKALSTPKKGFKITHPERVIYTKDNIKKIDVANFYKSVGPWILPYLVNRPLALMRCPDKAAADCFFQKHLNHPSLDEVLETEMREQKVNYIENELGLLQLIQWGVLELHVWQGLVECESPDQIVFDLDPDEKLPWKKVTDAALKLKDLLDRLDLKCFLKTTGGKGLHIQVPIAPIYSWEDVKKFSKTVVQQLSDENPNAFTTSLRKENRKNKIFLDYLRNGFGSTAVAPYSLRSKDHPTVGVPIDWKEIGKIKGGDKFDLKSTLVRLANQKKDPWANYFKTKQKIKILKPR